MPHLIMALKRRQGEEPNRLHGFGTESLPYPANLITCISFVETNPPSRVLLSCYESTRISRNTIHMFLNTNSFVFRYGCGRQREGHAGRRGSVPVDDSNSCFWVGL